MSEIDKFLLNIAAQSIPYFLLNRNRQEKSIVIVCARAVICLLVSEAHIKQHAVERVSTLLNDEFLLWDAHTFTELCDLAVSRLTLFNARRGGEPARLRILSGLMHRTIAG